MPIKILRRRQVRCAGCGKFGTTFCDPCYDFYKKTQARLHGLRAEEQKLMRTFCARFAVRGKIAIP